MAKSQVSESPEGVGRILLNLGLATVLGGSFGIGTTVIQTNGSDHMQDCKIAQEILALSSQLASRDRNSDPFLDIGSRLVKRAEQKVVECLGD